MTKYRINFNGHIYEMEIEKILDKPDAKVPMENIQIIPPVIQKEKKIPGDGWVLCSMPGQIIKILCKVGDVVHTGQVLMILEAMKMENEVQANRDGIVKSIAVEEGQTAASGDILVEIR